MKVTVFRKSKKPGPGGYLTLRWWSPYAWLRLWRRRHEVGKRLAVEAMHGSNPKGHRGEAPEKEE